MSKAYLLVICLLAVSFTGCMSGSDDNTETDTIDDETKQEDNTKQEEETEQEEELIDPVGEEMEDSSTDCNCTVIVEDESYDPEYFSSVFISNQQRGDWFNINGTMTYVEYGDANQFSSASHFRGFFNKTGNNVHITPVPTNQSVPSQVYYHAVWYQITIYGPDGLYWLDYVQFYDANYGGHYHEIDIELPWEPVGFSLVHTGEDWIETHSDSYPRPTITRPF